MIYWRYALRELQRRPGRWLISLLSVAIAVAAIVAVASATATTRIAYQQVFEALSGRADLEVVAHGGGRFNGDIAKKIEAVPGTRAVVPMFHRGTIVYAEGEKAKAMAVGFVPGNAETLAGLHIVAGRLPENTSEVAIQSSLASALHLKVGSKPRLLTSSGLRTYAISGIVDPVGASSEYATKWGAAIGFYLNRPNPAAAPGLYDAAAHHVVGFSYKLRTYNIEPIRVEALSQGVAEPHLYETTQPVVQAMQFAYLRQGTWVTSPTALDTSKLLAFRFHVPSASGVVRNFDFCVEEMAAIVTNQ